MLKDRYNHGRGWTTKIGENKDKMNKIQGERTKTSAVALSGICVLEGGKGAEREPVARAGSGYTHPWFSISIMSD